MDYSLTPYNWDELIKRILEETSPEILLDQIEDSYHAYPAEKPLTTLRVSAFPVWQKSYLFDNNFEQKTTFLDVLELKFKGLQETDNIVLVKKFIERKRKELIEEQNSTPQPLITDSNEEQETATTTTGVKPRFGEFSNSQLVLIFYYFFKYVGIEPRVSIDIAPIAKFLHLITGKEFSNVQSSDLYKKLSKAPNHVSDKSLIIDLNRIKPLFQKVELNEIVKMIDNEIEQCRMAIKETKTMKR